VLFVVNGLIKGEIEKPSGQYLGLICDESLTCLGLNLNLGHFGGFYLLSLYRVENHVFLPCVVLVIGMSRQAATRIVTGVGDLVQSTRDARTCQVLDDRVIERPSDAVCGLYHAQRDVGCFVWPQNQG
jgi:hypothetical protein